MGYRKKSIGHNRALGTKKHWNKKRTSYKRYVYRYGKKIGWYKYNKYHQMIENFYYMR